MLEFNCLLATGAWNSLFLGNSCPHTSKGSHITIWLVACIRAGVFTLETTKDSLMDLLDLHLVCMRYRTWELEDIGKEISTIINRKSLCPPLMKHHLALYLLKTLAVVLISGNL